MDDRPEAIRDYRDLIVWKEAMDIAESVYLLTRRFPREELFGMTLGKRLVSFVRSLEGGGGV